MQGQEKIQDEFKSFHMPRKDMPDMETIRYRVYTSPTQFVVIEADNAAEAMMVAAVGIPYKVVREMPLYHTLLSPKLIGLGVSPVASQEAAAPNGNGSNGSGHIPLTSLLADEEKEPSAPAAVQVAPEVTEAVSEAASATLSQDEINKLLEG